MLQYVYAIVQTIYENFSFLNSAQETLYISKKNGKLLICSYSFDFSGLCLIQRRPNCWIFKRMSEWFFRNFPFQSIDDP